MKLYKIKILSFILLCFISTEVFAYEIVRQDSFLLQAGYGQVAEIEINEIPAQSASYISGMPFDIEEALVQYNSSPAQGRLIATFNIISNTNFDLRIYSEPMRHIDENGNFDTSDDAPELHYILYFECNLGYYRNGVIQTVATDTFTFESRSNDMDNGKVAWSPDILFDEYSYVGNVDGHIHFMFDSESSIDISGADDTTLPRGNYGANVVIVIETDDSSSGVSI